MKEADLEASFLRLALQRSADLERNVKAANKAYDQLHRLKGRMRLLPDRGEAILKRIAEHQNAEVKIMACIALLAVDEGFAIEGLEKVVRTAPGLAGFTAATTIHEWRAGKLGEFWR